MQKDHGTILLKFQKKITFIIECMLSQPIHTNEGKIKAFSEKGLNIYILCPFHFKIYLFFPFLSPPFFFFERERETSIWEQSIYWLPLAWESNRKPGHLPYLGIKAATFWYTGWYPTNWATVARAKMTCAFWWSFKLNPANLHILRIKPYIMRLNNDACNTCGTHSVSCRHSRNDNYD